jgi:hypothetical protein
MDKEEIVETTPFSVAEISQDSPHVYTDLNTVPTAWRTYKSARLNLFQINEIISEAYATAIETETGKIPNYGGARAKFSESHYIEDGFWVKGDKQ